MGCWISRNLEDKLFEFTWWSRECREKEEDELEEIDRAADPSDCLLFRPNTTDSPLSIPIKRVGFDPFGNGLDLSYFHILFGMELTKA